ncbi:MAG: hypothetical protein K2G53_01420 [Muribaculaceae bacterium]|nr:hypothetical protein [Muribaculaceae bacterium]
MDREEDKLKQKYGTQGGWKVPEEYFEEVYKEIAAKLPEPEVQRLVEMTRWQRFKPYVYLAAMFAGIWLMMQVFRNVGSDMTLNLDNPPEQIAMAMADSDINESYFYLPESISDIEIENEVSGQYDSMEDFERDFGYEMAPEYASMSVNEENPR